MFGTRENYGRETVLTQNADFAGGRTMPGAAKIIMVLQTLVIVFLSSWIVEEYLNNRYLQLYINDVVQANGSLIAILVIVSGIGTALGLRKVLRSTNREIGALVSQPQIPSSGPVGSSSKPAEDLHPMVAALKAELAHHPSMEPILPIEVKETPSTPVQSPPVPPPTRSLAVVPTTVITGTMPVLKKANPERDRGQNSQQ